MALLRAFLANFFAYSDDICTLSRADIAPLFDPCDWTSECPGGRWQRWGWRWWRGAAAEAELN